MTTPPRFDIMGYSHHAIYKASGFTAKELSLPRIAVINSWSEQSPGHVHLKAVAEGVKAGIRMAGGMPFEINVPGLCSVPHKVESDMLYDMPQREAVLAAAESSLYISWCDGWVGIGTCDKITIELIGPYGMAAMWRQRVAACPFAAVMVVKSDGCVQACA